MVFGSLFVPAGLPHKKDKKGIIDVLVITMCMSRHITTQQIGASGGGLSLV